MSATPLRGGDEDEDPQAKAQRLAARAARFSNKLAGNRYKELDAVRQQHLKQLEEAAEREGSSAVGLTSGMDDATLMRGTCEEKCAEYEREFREFTGEINPYERRADGRMDHAKAVAAYTRSDAGAGVGAAAKLPSDLRTPGALLRSMNYLINTIMTSQPPGSASPTPLPQRKCLGGSVGFIRDRTRAIRKEFAMQSSWGALEAIEANEKIARWHILCLRELQENTGNQSDMHTDAAELGRCFTTLRQLYTDQRELGSQCANEAEFRAYMLIFDLTQKSTAILTGELPEHIAADPLVKAAWDIRASAQRNFDTQKEGSKQNSELGRNMLTRFAALLARPDLPFLLSALVEVRLREVRRSELRALRGVYPPFKGDKVVYDERGGIKERRMVDMDLLDKLLGCEEQEAEAPAYDDVEPVQPDPDTEARDVAQTFGVEMYEEGGRVIGAVINKASSYNDNVDAPFTRRWRAITEKRQNISFADIVNGQAGVYFANGVSRPAARSTPAAPSNIGLGIFRPPAAAPVAPSAGPTAPSFFSPFNTSKSPASIPAAPLSTTSKPFSFAPAPPPLAPTLQPPPVAAAPVAPKPTFSFEKPAPSAAAVPVPAPTFSFTLPKASVPAAPTPAPRFSPGSTTAPAAPASAPEPLFTFGDSSKVPSSPTPAPAVVPNAPASQPPSGPPTISLTIPSSVPSLPAAPPTPARPVVSREERKRRQDALPALLDELLSGAVETLLQERREVFSGLVEQEMLIRTKTTKRGNRARNIEAYSELLVNELVEAETKRLVEQARLYALRRRMLAREAGRGWHAWARRQGEVREQRRREEEEMFRSLSRMSTSMRCHDGIVDVDMDASPASQALTDMGTDTGDLEVDMVMRESSRLNEQFHAPSTFLSILASQVGLAYGPSNDPYSPLSDLTSEVGQVERQWTTLFSVAAEAGTAPDPAASAWLRRKFSPPSDEPFERHGFAFVTKQVERYDDVSVSADTGLIVFELPLRADVISAMDTNTDDAKDRLKALIRATTTPRNRYPTSLLLVSWEDTALHAVIKDLDIQAEVDSFANAGVVCLTKDEMDGLVEPVLERLILEAKPKERVYLDIEMMFGRHYTQSWSRLLGIVQQICRRFDADARTATGMVAAGLDVLDGLSRIFKQVTKGITWDPSTTYEQVHLSSSGSSVLALLEDAAQRLPSDDILLQIAMIKHTPHIPADQLVAGALAAVGNAFGKRLQGTYIALDQFHTTSKRVEVLNAYRDDILRRWDESVERAIGSIVPVPSAPPVVAAPPLKASAKVVGSAGSKRSRDEEVKESKAAKSARLFKLISTVNVDLERGIQLD